MNITSVNSNMQTVQAVHNANNSGQQLPTDKSLTPEMSNKLEAAKNDMLNESVDKIKSTYNTAWQFDLAKVHHNQQQALIDAYVYGSGGESSNSQSNSSLLPGSSVQSLTDVYRDIYEVKQKINELEGEKIAPPTQLPVYDNLEAANIARLHGKGGYDEVMEPQQTSFMHIAV